MVKIQFYDDVLDGTVDGDRVFVPLSQPCRALSIDYSSQFRRLKIAHWSETRVFRVPALDGKQRETLCISINTLAMWLATIVTDRINDTARPKIIRYQAACAATLGAMLARTMMIAAPDVAAKPLNRSVYFFADEDRVKIGISTDVRRRVLSLGNGFGKPLTVLGVIPGADLNTESDLHAKFDQYRLAGEWFSASADLMEFIRTNTASFAV